MNEDRGETRSEGGALKSVSAALKSHLQNLVVSQVTHGKGFFSGANFLSQEEAWE